MPYQLFKANCCISSISFSKMQYLEIEVFTAVFCISASHAAVTLKVKGLTAEVSNKLVKFEKTHRFLVHMWAMKMLPRLDRNWYVTYLAKYFLI